MPARKPNTDSGDTELNKLLGGRDTAGKFIKRTQQIEKMRAVIEKLSAEQAKAQKLIDKSTKSVTTALKRENVLLKGKNKLQNIISKSQKDQIKIISKAAKQREKQLKRETRLVQKNFRQQLRLETKLNRTREKLSRRSRGSRGGGLSLGRLGAGVAGLGLGFAAIQQIRNITDKRLETFLNLGRGATGRIGSLGGRGIAGVSKFAALNEFQGQGTSQFIQGQSEAIQEALLSAQDRLSKTVGTTTANKLLADISKSFGADVGRRREFFETTGQQGIEPALQKFIGQFNFPEFSRAINALQQPDDPILQQNAKFAEVVEQLKATFEKLVVTVGKDLIPIVEKLVPKMVSLLQSLANLTSGDLIKGVAVGAGGLIATRVAGGAISGLVTKAIGTAGAGVAGIGAVGIGSALLAGDQFTRFAQGNGTIGGSLTDSLFGFDEKQAEINRKGDAELLKALGMAPREFRQKQKRLQEQNQQQDAKRLQALRKETKALDKAAKSAEKFSKSVETPARDSLASRIERREELELPKQLQDSISSIRREQLGTARISPFGSRLALDELKALNESLRQQQDKLRDILSTFDTDDPRGQLEANKVRTQIASIERELRANRVALQQAPLQVEQAETDLRRQEFQLRRLSPLGTIGAFPELQEINKSLKDEIAILQRMAASSELSALETINVKRAVLSRRLEIRQNQRAFLDAFKDAALQQVLQSGAGGRSIIISREQNVGVGLRKGIFGLDKNVSRSLLGNVDPNVVPETPKTASEILGFNPFERIDRLTPRNLEPVTMKGHKMIVESVDKLRKSFEAPKSSLDKVTDPTGTVGQRRQVVKPRAGQTSADSMVSVGRFMIGVGEQMKQEQQNNDNRFSEPITKYAGNRLNNVQAVV